jgi:hypothetical protein
MRLVLHPKVYSDIDEIMGYYERVACHFLFRIVGDAVRILVVRHPRRRPTVGIRRQ